MPHQTSRKQRPLNQWLKIQQQNREEAENQVRDGASKLVQAEEQLSTLESFRTNHGLNRGTVRNGLTLNSTQQFHEQVDEMILFQHQQVAMQKSQQRRRDQQLKDNHIEVRKTEILLERYHKEEMLHDNRRNQNRQDEMASIMLRRVQEF